ADAYGQYTNNLGVALVTAGPGGTNALTGLAAAWLESTPCLFLSGQVKRDDIATGRGIRQLGFQELPIVDIVKPITKYAVTVMEPDRIRYHLEKALYLARTGRPGPVWLDIPLDVQSASIEEKGLVGFDHSEFQIDFDEETLRRQVKETIELLNQAERPVLLAGNGVRLAKVIPEFLVNNSLKPLCTELSSS
ncbi:MAG: thiamine pyrophosphate-binding protein, partial [Nanoarchaeota archaeon]|nr:thiamine pyrophosphate-binding protein [Nanoarchaeota archaeon]